MNSNEKTKPVGKKANKEPTIEELLLEDDAPTKTSKKVSNTSALQKFKDVKEKTTKLPKIEDTSKDLDLIVDDDKEKKKSKKKKKEDIVLEEQNSEEIDLTLDEENLSKEELKKLKKEEKKKNKRKFRNGEKLFIFLNLVVIFYIIGFYGYRAYYYHKKLNVDVLNTTPLKEVITNIKNITYSGDGLYEDDENKIYYYKGKEVKNYVYFEGRLWQILTIGENIKMIQVDNVASIVAGIKTEYKTSNLHTWLEDYSKTFKDSENYLEKTKWCNKEVDIKNYKCEEYVEDSIGLLTFDDYVRAGLDASFIPTNQYFWMMNYNSDKEFYYVNDKGQINNNVNDNENYFSFGLRPVITVKSDVLYQRGEGTLEDPYVIGEVGNTVLKDNHVGCYVKYNNYTFRIINADDTGTEMILDGIIDEKVSFNNSNKFLNDYFVSKFNSKDLVKMNADNYVYNYANKYNYKEVNPKTTVSTYARIPNIGEYYTASYSDYWLNNIFDKNLKLYSVILDNNTYFSDLATNGQLLRPVIKIEPNMVIESGIGLSNDPIIIGEANETKEN